MSFGTFLITFGVIGIWFLLGVMTRTLWLRDDVHAVRTWSGPLLFMGGIGAFTSSYHPIVEPLWLHYVLIVGIPLVVGYVGLALLIGRGAGNSDDEGAE